MKSSNSDKLNKRIGMILTVFILFILGFIFLNRSQTVQNTYQDDWLMQHLNRQLENGPRLPGSDSHEKTKDYITSMLATFEWTVIEQDWMIGEIEFTNIIAYDDSCKNDERILIGAHYDNRIYADHDLDIEKRFEPVQGANDGASGVAVLLDLARLLQRDTKCNAALVFFDAEDNGGIEDYDWIMGSRYFVDTIEEMPFVVSKAVIVDMIGDADLNIYYERHSNVVIREEIWLEAENLGYNTTFIQEEKHSILDDHIPFIESEIPAVDIIDFDYPYWHTTNDTIENVSIESLKIVIDVVNSWLGKQ